MKFAFFVTNEFSVSQQMDIFDHFSKFRIYNCIFVSLERDVIDKLFKRPIKVNDVEKDIILFVYNWFPYQNSDRFTEVSDVTLLDSCVISAQGHFTKNTDLFPRKISNSLSGCPMKAFAMDSQWNFTTKYVQYNYTKGNVRTYKAGLEFNLIMVVLQQKDHVFSPKFLKWS